MNRKIPTNNGSSIAIHKGNGNLVQVFIEGSGNGAGSGAVEAEVLIRAIRLEAGLSDYSCQHTNVEVSAADPVVRMEDFVNGAKTALDWMTSHNNPQSHEPSHYEQGFRHALDAFSGHVTDVHEQAIKAQDPAGAAQ